MNEPNDTKITTIEHTMSPIEGELIKNHIKIEKIKLWFSLV